MKKTDIMQQLQREYPEAIASESLFLGETTWEVRKKQLKALLTALKKTPEPGYEVLMDLTGVDYLEPVPQTKVVYWLHSPTTFDRLRLVVFVRREESMPSVSDLWGGGLIGMNASSLTSLA